MPTHAKRLHEVKNNSFKHASETPDRDRIAVRAYQLWLGRGCPIGTDQEDWFRAENELKNRKDSAEAASAN